MTNPRERGAQRARQVYEEFHQAAPEKLLRMDIAELPRELPLLGQVEEIVYSIPRGVTSDRAGYHWRHTFGDTGHGDTGAKPYVVGTGHDGELLIVSKPNERKFSIEEAGIVG